MSAVLLAVLALLLLPGPGPSAHGAHEPDPVGIQGEILDLTCYVVHQVRGGENDLCAGHHPDDNQPLALLSADGRLYVLYAWHRSSYPLDRARTLRGRQVTVTGIPTEMDTIRLLEVREIELQEKAP